MRISDCSSDVCSSDLAACWFLVSNTLHNLSSRNIASGFGFLEREAGFAIGESPIEFGPENTYARAVLVGLLNTLRVYVIGIILATFIGTVIGIARLSKNWQIGRASCRERVCQYG